MELQRDRLRGEPEGLCHRAPAGPVEQIAWAIEANPSTDPASGEVLIGGADWVLWVDPAQYTMRQTTAAEETQREAKELHITLTGLKAAGDASDLGRGRSARTRTTARGLALDPQEHRRRREQDQPDDGEPDQPFDDKASDRQDGPQDQENHKESDHVPTVGATGPDRPANVKCPGSRRNAEACWRWWRRAGHR